MAFMTGRYVQGAPLYVQGATLYVQAASLYVQAAYHYSLGASFSRSLKISSYDHMYKLILWLSLLAHPPYISTA